MNNLKNKRFLLAVMITSVILFVLPLFTVGCSSLGTIKENVISVKDIIVSRLNKSDIEKSAVDTVEEFFDAVIKEDFEKAYLYIYIAENQRYSFEDFKKEFADVTSIISIKTKWIEVKNNIAIVGIDLIDSYDDEEKIYKDIEISLVKGPEEKWKINFWR